MTPQELFEKYRHLDHLLSDPEFLHHGLAEKILVEAWEVIKTMAQEPQAIKGDYIFNQDQPVAFLCRLCDGALTIVEDPEKEQPNFCYNCGRKFDWEGVYQAAIKRLWDDETE